LFLHLLLEHLINIKLRLDREKAGFADIGDEA
jgi:hypothetical protein